MPVSSASLSIFGLHCPDMGLRIMSSAAATTLARGDKSTRAIISEYIFPYLIISPLCLVVQPSARSASPFTPHYRAIGCARPDRFERRRPFNHSTAFRFKPPALFINSRLILWPRVFLLIPSFFLSRRHIPVESPFPGPLRGDRSRKSLIRWRPGPRR